MLSNLSNTGSKGVEIRRIEVEDETGTRSIITNKEVSILAVRYNEDPTASGASKQVTPYLFTLFTGSNNTNTHIVTFNNPQGNRVSVRAVVYLALVDR